ncbi:hypothetical protein EYF80_049325 [Liparis tanakae]|uniref:Uncharacterized protein n=1 Tax=Liparis tanakae TaxID=230148 RepID=A0A4Z2FHV5_9TELE|nr:hypothetical protein EYF80_049325 [Liparis tanakae]
MSSPSGSETPRVTQPSSILDPPSTLHHLSALQRSIHTGTTDANSRPGQQQAGRESQTRGKAFSRRPAAIHATKTITPMRLTATPVIGLTIPGYRRDKAVQKGFELEEAEEAEATSRQLSHLIDSKGKSDQAVPNVG